VAVGSPPTVRRRQLGRELRKLREGSGLLIDQLAERMRCSTSRISRIETARIRIAPGTVHEILDILGASGETRDRLVALARQADEPGWWQEYSDVLPFEYSTYIALEAEAVRLRSFEPIAVHGLLQTPQYAATLVSRQRSGAELAARLAVRLARQGVLTKPEPAELWVILDESVIRREVGGPELMRHQIKRLVGIADLPNVTIQLVPFAVGAYGAMTGSFTVMDFANPDEPNVVYQENYFTDHYVETPSGVARYVALFEEIASQALDAESTVGFLKRVADQ